MVSSPVFSTGKSAHPEGGPWWTMSCRLVGLFSKLGLLPTPKDQGPIAPSGGASNLPSLLSPTIPLFPAVPPHSLYYPLGWVQGHRESLAFFSQLLFLCIGNMSTTALPAPPPPAPFPVVFLFSAVTRVGLMEPGVEMRLSLVHRLCAWHPRCSKSVR